MIEFYKLKAHKKHLANERVQNQEMQMKVLAVERMEHNFAQQYEMNNFSELSSMFRLCESTIDEGRGTICSRHQH